MPILHSKALSGHANRAEMFPSLIGESATLIDLDLAAGAHKSEEFLSLNPLGQAVAALDATGVARAADGTGLRDGGARRRMTRRHLESRIGAEYLSIQQECASASDE